MAVRIDRFGNNYADNVLSYKMMFENTGTWNVSSGTGNAEERKDTSFEGAYSLLLQNTDVVNDLIATNATHTTEILKSGEYGFSFYLYKTESLQPITGNIKIFKNAVLLDTQNFTLGSADADTDENEVWVRYISDNSYDLTFTDDITFTFTIDGIPGSVLVDLDLYFDGLMLYPLERNNYVCPLYVKPKLPEPITLKTSIKTGAYTAVDGDVVLCDGTSGAFSVTLPPVATSNDYEIVVKKIDVSANVITIDGNASETIDGATTQDLTTQYDSMHMICDGTAWYII